MKKRALVAVVFAGACAHGEPPQWDAGPAGYAVAPLPGTEPVVRDAAAAVAPAPGATPDAGPPSAAAPSGDESGKLRQTHDEPQPSGAAFDARVRALWDAVVADDPDRAMAFFFPLTAYQQVKGIANPSADWKNRLVAHYVRDIHALHAKLGPNASHARFLRAEVPMDHARWVEPGEEYNKIGYFRVYGTKLVGDVDGSPFTVDVTSLISWRGEWFCVHLTGVK